MVPACRRILPAALALSFVVGSAFAQPAPARDRFAIPATDEGLPGAGPIRRYDWFQKLWQERRSTWAREVAQDRHAVVFLGDSITQMWGGGLGAAFPGVKVANRGISGDTTRGVLIRLEEDVLALDPAAVVLLIGTNDLEEGATPEIAARNLELIVAALERHAPKTPIVLCQVFPSSAKMKRPADQIKAMNALYLAAVKGDARVTYLETWPLFADANGDAKLSEFPDLLHPNEVGYAKWAAALRPVFATLGLSETTADPFTPEEGFVSLFNGRDLTGWGFRQTSDADRERAAKWRASDPNAPPWPLVDEAVSFDGKTSTPDGRYAVIGGRLVVTAPPEYRRLQQMWTTREFGDDFVLRLEFRATPNADSGVFIRRPQLQCRDYALAGPYKTLARYRPQEWNELEITVHGGAARATCNGELLEAALEVPASGPIGLEGDRGQVEYRRIRVKHGATGATGPSAHAFAVNQKLGRAVNIIGYDPIWQDRTKARFKEGYFSRIREAGFTAVRVNLHPFRHMDPANGHTLKPAWLDTLDWTVNGALAARLAVILDMHEFHAMAEDPAGRKAAWLAFWTQVATRFKDAPDEVVFELLNEPFGSLTPELWNEYLKEGLAVVRATNPTRVVIVGGGRWNSIDGLQALVLPESDRHLIATVHYYTPMDFTHQGAPWSAENKDTSGVLWTGSDKERRRIELDFAKAQQWAVTHDRPIHLGEFGAYDKADMDSRARYTAGVARTAEGLGWSWAYWQFDSDFIVYDVAKDAWVEPLLRALIP